MAIKVTRAVLWIINAALAVTLVLLAIKANSATAGPAVVAEPVRDAAAFSSAAREPLSDEQVREMLSSGRIVPLPKVVTPDPTPAPVEEPTAPEPIDVAREFKCTLIGTIVETEAAYAFLEEAGGRQRVAKQGDTVGNAKIIGIWEDRILIEISGERGYIEVPERDGGLVTARSAVVSSARERYLPPEPVITSVTSPYEEGGDDEEGTDEFDEEELDWDVVSEAQYLDYIQNLGKYVSQVVILTHFDEEKKPDGLILTKVPRDSEAFKRGLREGDIVRSVQGQSVVDLQAAIKVAYQVLRDNEYLVDVIIERNGVEEVFSYEVWPE
jgi:type II secretory pathway component PulC